MGGITGLTAIILIFGSPVILIVALTYLVQRKRHFAHLERMKMIEGGLVTNEADFPKVEQSMASAGQAGWFDFLYVLALGSGVLIFIAGVLYSLFFFAFLKTPEHTGFALKGALLGVILTFLFTLSLKALAYFKDHRARLISGCLILNLLWSLVLVNEIRSLSFAGIKDSIQNKLKITGHFDDVGDLEGMDVLRKMTGEHHPAKGAAPAKTPPPASESDTHVIVR